jgi:hypothetical protein
MADTGWALAGRLIGASQVGGLAKADFWDRDVEM